jgi:glutathione peroxidase
MMKTLRRGLLGIALAGTAAGQSVYDFSAVRINGDRQNLSDYRRQVLLIVNTASKCGFTRQYAGLQTLYETHRARGLTILGFPSNNFGWQEPGTNGEIEKFCNLRFGISFPMFEKIAVKGADIHPLYAWLTAHPSGAAVSWNFNKFLIGRDGRLIAHFGSRVEPDSEELAAAIEQALKESAP